LSSPCIQVNVSLLVDIVVALDTVIIPVCPVISSSFYGRLTIDDVLCRVCVVLLVSWKQERMTDNKRERESETAVVMENAAAG
jgi:hypothetical protein